MSVAHHITTVSVTVHRCQFDIPVYTDGNDIFFEARALCNMTFRLHTYDPSKFPIINCDSENISVVKFNDMSELDTTNTVSADTWRWLHKQAQTEFRLWKLETEVSELRRRQSADTI